MNERWLSVEEIAAHLGVNPDTIYKWIERKKMPAHKVGRLWKFQATEVDAWIRDGRASEPVNEAGEQPEVLSLMIGIVRDEQARRT